MKGRSVFMPNTVVVDTHACKTCQIGSCCYEGVELTAEELKRIIASRPLVPKPWFRKLSDSEQSDQDHPFATVVRNGTCVFQGQDNLCTIYPVRPQYCRDFPIEEGKTAPHYCRLCVLFHEEWPAASQRKKNLLRREGPGLEKKLQQIEKSVDF